MPDQRVKPALGREPATIFVLALAPAIGVGIVRFAYSLLLPDMRTSLHWSYAAAGFMNTINAAGYLVGALIAAALMRRIGQFGGMFYGSLICLLALALSAVSANFVLLSAARLAAGIGGAVAFVAGGVAAAHVSQHHPGRAALLLSLYYIGPGLGIVVSSVAIPLLLATLGPGTWWLAWGALAVISAVFCLALLWVRDKEVTPLAAKAQSAVPLMPMAPILISYCLFSIGTIAYMTFMIAWLINKGAGAVAQSAFWSLLGFGGMCAPFLWSWAIAALRGGGAVAMLTAITFVASVAGLFVDVRVVQFISAFVFGSVLLAVVAATTVFVRQNLPSAAWPSGVSAMTVAFGLGQTLGPVLSGAITDTTGDLTLGLQSTVALLVLAAVLGAFQRDLAPPAPAR
jgi:predicted MFS family arabinose efflux permease